LMRAGSGPHTPHTPWPDAFGLSVFRPSITVQAQTRVIEQQPQKRLLNFAQFDES